MGQNLPSGQKMTPTDGRCGKNITFAVLLLRGWQLEWCSNNATQCLKPNAHQKTELNSIVQFSFPLFIEPARSCDVVADS